MSNSASKLQYFHLEKVQLPMENDGSRLLNMVKTSIKVAGMTCQHCVNSVTEEVSALAGVVSVQIDLASGNVQIESENQLEASDLKAAVQEAGYEVISE